VSARSWLAPGVILVSTGAMLQAFQGSGASPLRTVLVVWFLAVCPGLAVIGLLRLADPWIQAAATTALSFAIDMLVAAVLSYADLWSPTSAVVILALVSVGGAVAQIAGAARALGRERGA
jgi:hypothetical protein